MKIRFLHNAILLFTLCLFALLTPVATLHAQVTLSTGTPFNIVNENSGACIDATNHGTANGTTVQQWACSNGTFSTATNQQWVFTNGSVSGYYEVTNVNASNEAWNVVNVGTTSGSLIQLWTYASASNEEWAPISLGNGFYKFVGLGSGLCLDVPGASTANGVQLQIFTCNGTAAQAFKLVLPSGGGTGSCTAVPSAPTGLAASGTTSSGTTLTWTADTAPANCSISSYTVLENGNSIGTATGTSFAVGGLSPSTTYSFTLKATDSDGTSSASSALSVTTLASSGGEGPFGGTPAAIPGTVMAENYDTGGQGLGYSVGTINGSNNGYRSDGVDLEVASAPATGNDIGWSASGQWFHYTVKVATAGTYTVSFLVAAESAISDAFHLTNSSGTNLSGSVAVPNTGNWQTWTTVTATVTLPAGQQTLMLSQDNGGWNIDSMVFTSGSGGGNPPPGKVFAPFEYLGDLGDANQVTGIVSSSGAKAVVLAFLDPNNNGCSLIWPGANGPLPNDTIGSTSVGTVIAGLQARGVTVVISGGGAGATDGSAFCGNAGQVQSLYQSVLNQYHVKWLDFDIEIGQTSGQVQRRDQALAALKAANPGLIVSYTLPLGPGGLDAGDNGTGLLTSAKADGLSIDIVDGMAMDFGQIGADQTSLSKSGAAALKSQIASAGLSSTVGLTFLPGNSDDNPTQIFSLANASTMVTFANANSYITMLSFWELNRDNGGCPGSTSDQDTCSGISQSNFEFSSIFEAF